MNRLGTFFLGFLVGGAVVYFSLHYHVVRAYGRHAFGAEGNFDVLGNLRRCPPFHGQRLDRSSGPGGGHYAQRENGHCGRHVAKPPARSVATLNSCCLTPCGRGKPAGFASWIAAPRTLEPLQSARLPQPRQLVLPANAT